MAELMRLWQKGTVTDYHTEFDAIVSRIDLYEAHQLSCFLGGLQLEIQMMVRVFQPTSVMKVFSLAKMYENANATSMEVKPISKNLRPTDHHIHLVPNSEPVNVRPYRYPHYQKAEIETQVSSML